MFRTNHPVTSASFFNREKELTQLLVATENLAKGFPAWLMILGPRKIGKTSLMLECARRAEKIRVLIVSIDTTEESPIGTSFFRRYALRVVDAAFGPELGESPEALALEPNAYRAALAESKNFNRLDVTTRHLLFGIPDMPMSEGFIRQCLELPERLAKGLGISFMIAIDEFQELSALQSKRRSVSPFHMMRSTWQIQKRTSYVVSGSARSMLRALVTEKTSPFFQHFSIIEMGPMPREAAVRLLVESGTEPRKIPEHIAEQVVDLLGCRPFYLQLFGDALTRTDPPYDRDVLAAVLQDLLFSRTGRLSLYFQNEFNLLVGQSRNLAAVLETLAKGPQKLSEIARAIGAPAGQASSYVQRLDDAVCQTDKLYKLDDQTFGLWLQWKKPGGSIVPTSVLGTRAEFEVAKHLAASGFELVYQSRASRGAFDLMAVREATQLGVQVRGTKLPVRFTKTEWNRLEADSLRFGWPFIIAVAPPKGRVILLDPKKATRKNSITLSEQCEIDNILTWVDGS